MSPAPTGERTVPLWCTACRDYVPLTGPTYGPGAQSPVHITPAAWDTHRRDVHGETVPDRSTR